MGTTNRPVPCTNSTVASGTGVPSVSQTVTGRVTRCVTKPCVTCTKPPDARKMLCSLQVTVSWSCGNVNGNESSKTTRAYVNSSIPSNWSPGSNLETRSSVDVPMLSSYITWWSKEKRFITSISPPSTPGPTKTVCTRSVIPSSSVHPKGQTFRRISGW